MESIKQKKVGKIIQETLSGIFQREGANIYGQAFITITNVSVTPDLLVARVYLSIYNVRDKEGIVAKIEAEKNHLRKQLGNRIKHQMRRVPELQFFLDDTLDYVFKMEEVFKKIKNS